MIIREIKASPEILDNFDWFNDYKDTKHWAERNAPEMVRNLVDGFDRYLQDVKMKSKIAISFFSMIAFWAFTLTGLNVILSHLTII